MCLAALSAEWTSAQIGIDFNSTVCSQARTNVQASSVSRASPCGKVSYHKSRYKNF